MLFARKLGGKLKGGTPARLNVAHNLLSLAYAVEYIRPYAAGEEAPCLVCGMLRSVCYCVAVAFSQSGSFVVNTTARNGCNFVKLNAAVEAVLYDLR